MPQVLTNFLAILLTSQDDIAQRTTADDLSRFVLSGLAEADGWYASQPPIGDSLRDIIVVLGPQGRTRVFLGDHEDLISGELDGVRAA